MVALGANAGEMHEQLLLHHLRVLIALLVLLLQILPVKKNFITTAFSGIRRTRNIKTMCIMVLLSRVVMMITCLGLEHELYGIRKCFDSQLRYRDWSRS